MTSGGRGGRARPRRRRRDATGERSAVRPPSAERPARRAPAEQPPVNHPSPDQPPRRRYADDQAGYRPPADSDPPGGLFAARPTTGHPAANPPAQAMPPGGRPFAQYPPGDQAPPAGPFPDRPVRPAPGTPSRGRVTAGRWFTEQADGEPPPVEPHSVEPPFVESPPASAAAGASGKRKADKRSKRRRSSWSLGALADWGLDERQQRVLLGIAGGAAVLAMAIVLTVLVARVAELSEPPPAAAGGALRIDLARPDDYQGWRSLPQFAPIADRESDPAPLTAEEIFRVKTLKSGKITLRLVQRQADKDCSVALWGDELLAKLAETGCTQAVRGLYRSADGRYVAQYTLFNMSGVAAADGFVQALTTLHRDGWVRPLDDPSAVFPADGYTEASGHAMGHLAALVWVGRADGAEPTARDDFVALALAVRGAEKAVFARVVAAGGEAATPQPR
ncbi:hypothetical protein AB0K60_23490 [Thermopolyspora sp. NPDC052614]|uniref:hypothetical protein n=1 Tax=Thermopolyspora sp. NPDC052614 TaxID=3155682 RepID=UPI003447CF78